MNNRGTQQWLQVISCPLVVLKILGVFSLVCTYKVNCKPTQLVLAETVVPNLKIYDITR